MLASFGIEWEEREYGQIFLHGTGGPACGIDGSRLPQCRGGIAVQPYVRRNPARGRPVLCGNVRRHPTGPAPCHRNREPRMARLRGNGWGMRLARQWGHKVVPVRPVLAPLLLPESWPLHGLAGVSLPAAVSVGGRTFRYPLLFTHKGLSGPAILQASCFWRQGEALHIDFLSDHPALELMHQPEHGKSTVLGLFKRCSPPAWPNGSYRDRWLQEKSLSLPKRQGIPCASNT